MLDRGADVNVKDRDGSTALEEAVYYGNVKAVRLLLEQHANVHLPTSEGTSILSEAIACRRDNPEEPAYQQIVSLLKKAGAKK
ncbi:MAG TPA: ankyrin repeat domain-containing protein [Chthonomonadaceae bacterium]|nr:ankyrin repeat domain-containing protein [Chthonomonadaceae bacterium]